MRTGPGRDTLFGSLNGICSMPGRPNTVVVADSGNHCLFSVTLPTTWTTTETPLPTTTTTSRRCYQQWREAGYPCQSLSLPRTLTLCAAILPSCRRCAAPLPCATHHPWQEIRESVHSVDKSRRILAQSNTPLSIAITSLGEAGTKILQQLYDHPNVLPPDLRFDPVLQCYVFGEPEPYIWYRNGHDNMWWWTTIRPPPPPLPYSRR